MNSFPLNSKCKVMCMIGFVPSVMSSSVSVCVYESSNLEFEFVFKQAQRDYFGAHTYELLTSPGKFVHTNWTGHGGNVSASTYQA